jgi:recombination protein U
MTINYPNGKRYNRVVKRERSINTRKVKDSFSNRGMSLEDSINDSNTFYSTQNICIVHKKPTPITIVSVDNTTRSTTRITEAYFQVPSTTDYNGIYKGKYIDFEAKETSQKTSFPLQNFHDHQIIHMKKVNEHGGICFIIFHFKAFDETYLLDSDIVISFWKSQQTGGRKSIPKAVIEKEGHFIPVGYHPMIDYIKIVDRVYFA